MGKNMYIKERGAKVATQEIQRKKQISPYRKHPQKGGTKELYPMLW